MTGGGACCQATPSSGPTGTRSSASPHPSVIIGNKSSVKVGPGVFVGQGKGTVPLDDPNAPNKTRCAILDGYRIAIESAS
jgi:hypothetical protein